jgi:hypothetical protein
MDHTTDALKEQTHCSLSIIDKEIMSSIFYFVNEMKLNIGPEEIQQFIYRDKQRRSLFGIGKNIVLNICSFMFLGDTIVLLMSCKRFASYIPNIWRIYEHMYFTGSTMSTLGATPIFVKRSIAIDLFQYNVKNDCHLDRLLRDIRGPEQKIEMLKKANGRIYNAEQKCFRSTTPSLRTVFRYKKNLSYIKSFEKELVTHYGKNSDYTLGCLEMFRWLCPAGYFSSMPAVDDRLYTGIREKEQIEDNRNRIRRHNGWDSDDPDDGSWAD